MIEFFSDEKKEHKIYQNNKFILCKFPEKRAIRKMQTSQ